MMIELWVSLDENRISEGNYAHIDHTVPHTVRADRAPLRMQHLCTKNAT
jgi:quercetin dioxygenase-like cupin family protein